MTTYLTPDEVTAALTLRDLTNVHHGEHAIQILLDDIVSALTDRWGIEAVEHRHPPLVATRDNYDRLGYRADDVTRESRYSRHLSPTVMLRSHTTADVPAVLDHLDRAEEGEDRLHVLPGLSYRRDAVDRTHVGAPHQVDLWRVSHGRRLAEDDLEEMIAVIVEAVLPGSRHRTTPAIHPYTSVGRQVDVWHEGDWLELAECGLAGEQTLRASGLDPLRWSGLALGLGLDRALMLRKRLDDIRMLRSDDPRITSQMHDLSPWRRVSVMPAIRRDLSIVTDSDVDEEVLGDQARTALGSDADLVEALTVTSVTKAEDLPSGAVQRLQIEPGQVNVVIRLTLQALDRTLTDSEANLLRDRVYRSVHRGPVQELIMPAEASLSG